VISLSLRLSCAGWRSASVRRSDATAGLGLGPQLFLDDYLVGLLEGLCAAVSSRPSGCPGPCSIAKTFAPPSHTDVPARRGAAALSDSGINAGAAFCTPSSATASAGLGRAFAWDLRPQLRCQPRDDGKERRPEAALQRRTGRRAATARTRMVEDTVGCTSASRRTAWRLTAYEKNPVLSSWPEGAGNEPPRRQRHC